MKNELMLPQYGADFGLQVSLGKVPGYASLNKYGKALDCDSGDPTDIWDGANGSLSTKIWAPPTQARVHQLTSSSVDDTVSGSGARTVKVYYLPDWDTEEKSITVDLAGASNVALPSAVIIHRMKVKTSGTGGVNAGDLTATADVDSTITAAILTGENQTQMCIYGIPSPVNARISLYYASIIKATGSTQRADGKVLMMPDPATNAANNTAWTNKEDFNLVESNPPWEHDYKNHPKKTDGPCIIKMQVTCNSNDVKCIAGFDGVVVRDF